MTTKRKNERYELIDMKKLLLFAIPVMMTGCWGYPTDGNIFVRTVTIDSCEYLSYSVGQGFSHKGNCKFCQQRRKKEINALIEKVKGK